jgi:putative membrane protein
VRRVLMMMWNDGMGWGWMLFAGLLTLVFWGAIIALVVWGIKKVTEREGSRPKSAEKRDALDIAKERYAKGEISREEFEQIKKDLS